MNTKKNVITVLICFLFTIFLNVGCEDKVVDNTPLLDIQCANVSFSGGSAIAGRTVNITATVPYTNGNGKIYPTISFSSASVTGLTASLATGNLNNGTGNLTFTITGVPAQAGQAVFAFAIGTKTCSFNLPVNSTTSPASANLLLPNDNAPCINPNGGVQFTWAAADNASSYILNITNIVTGVKQSLTTNATTYSVTNLIPGSYYSWSVVSKSNTVTDTALSLTRKFYVAAALSSNYAPYPAQLIAPANNASGVSLPLTFQWTGNDPDGVSDIVNYTLYIDDVLQATTTNQTYQISSGLASGNHTWYIVTTDKSNAQTASTKSKFSN